MAYVGLAMPVIKPATGAGMTLGKAVGVDIEPQYSEASLYGDNKKAEYEKKFKYAKIKLETTSLPEEGHKALFGHTVETDVEKNTTTITNKDSDKSNYVGFGIYTEEVVDGITKYVAAWMPKVKFSDANTSWETKGDSIAYKAPSIEGEALADDAGEWKVTTIYKTEEEAVEYLNTKAGIVK